MPSTFVALLFLLLLATYSANSPVICPNVEKADTHFDLTVVNSRVPLPGGKYLQEGLTFNGSYIGPLLSVMLGDEISIDVHNHADVGERQIRVTCMRERVRISPEVVGPVYPDN